MSIFTKGWYVVYTRPQQERKLAERLSELEIKSYLPVIKTLRQWHDRQKYVELPLFPNYVFVMLSSLVDYHKVSDINGFVSYIRFGKDVARVDNAVIENIRLASKDEHLEVLPDDFKIGQRLIINKGPFTGLNCELVDYNGKTKAIVRLKLLNRIILVDIQLDEVSICEPINYTCLN